MSRHLPIPPDPMPLREALRGLRFMLRRGGETLADTLTIETLPKPAADLAGAVLREVGGLAQSMEDVASGIAKTVLGGGSEGQALHLQDLGPGQAADTHFAKAFYVALRSVLRRLGAPGVFVSEAAAKSVHGQNSARDAGLSAEARAAILTLALLEAKVVRGTTAEEAARVPGSALEPVAVFAVMLWLQSDRSEAENEAALDAATDLAVALAPDVARACAARDAGGIGALYRTYVSHV